MTILNLTPDPWFLSLAYRHGISPRHQSIQHIVNFHQSRRPHRSINPDPSSPRSMLFSWTSGTTRPLLGPFHPLPSETVVENMVFPQNTMTFVSDPNFTLRHPHPNPDFLNSQRSFTTTSWIPNTSTFYEQPHARSSSLIPGSLSWADYPSVNATQY